MVLMAVGRRPHDGGRKCRKRPASRSTAALSSTTRAHQPAQRVGHQRRPGPFPAGARRLPRGRKSPSANILDPTRSAARSCAGTPSHGRLLDPRGRRRRSRPGSPPSARGAVSSPRSPPSCPAASSRRTATPANRILVDPKTHQVLGIHVLGAYRDDLGRAVLEMELTVEDLRQIVFPHPTVSEVIREPRGPSSSG